MNEKESKRGFGRENMGKEPSLTTGNKEHNTNARYWHYNYLTYSIGAIIGFSEITSVGHIIVICY